MSAANNYWDAQLRMWIDPDTGNRSPDGVNWSNPQGGQYINGQWYGPGTQNPTMPSGSGTPSTSTGGSTPGFGTQGYGVLPGYQWYVDQANRDHEDAIQQAQQRFQAQQQQLQMGQQQHLAEVDAALQRELQAGRIASDQYMQQRTLAQQESEFARDLALRSLTADRDYAIQKASEMRQERLQEAQLEANPTDFVASQFYKRNLGTPKAWDLAQQFSQGGTASPAPNAGVTTTAQTDANGNPLDPTTGKPVIDPNNLTDINGNPYPKASPAYDDATIQKLVSSFYGGNAQVGTQPSTTQTLYNPAQGGTGAFGAKIGNPGSIGRAQFNTLGDEGMGLLTSFLNAGVDVNGKKVPINAKDYFTQSGNSWIPTFSAGTSGGTAYS